MTVDPAIRDDGVASTAPVSYTVLGWLKAIWQALSGGVSGGPVAGRDASVAIVATNVWQRVLAENASRTFIELQNTGSNNMYYFWAPIGNANVVPVPVAGTNGLGMHLLVPTGAAGPAGRVLTNELWVCGTIGDMFVVTVSV